MLAGSSGISFTTIPENPLYDNFPLFKKRNIFPAENININIAVIINLAFFTMFKNIYIPL